MGDNARVYARANIPRMLSNFPDVVLKSPGEFRTFPDASLKGT